MINHETILFAVKIRRKMKQNLGTVRYGIININYTYFKNAKKIYVANMESHFFYLFKYIDIVWTTLYCSSIINLSSAQNHLTRNFMVIVFDIQFYFTSYNCPAMRWTKRDNWSKLNILPGIYYIIIRCK